MLVISTNQCIKVILHWATKLLHLEPYKFSVQKLHEADSFVRVQFCKAVSGDDAESVPLYFSDEAWFHLSKHVNTQNYKYWLKHFGIIHTFVMCYLACNLHKLETLWIENLKLMEVTDARLCRKCIIVGFISLNVWKELIGSCCDVANLLFCTCVAAAALVNILELTL
jgi:hypothetical protein